MIVIIISIKINLYDKLGEIIVNNTVHWIAVLANKYRYLGRKRVDHTEYVGEARVGKEKEENAVDVLHTDLIEFDLQKDESEHDSDEERLNDHYSGFHGVTRWTRERTPN